MCLDLCVCSYVFLYFFVQITFNTGVYSVHGKIHNRVEMSMFPIDLILQAMAHLFVSYSLVLSVK